MPTHIELKVNWCMGYNSQELTISRYSCTTIIFRFKYMQLIPPWVLHHTITRFRTFLVTLCYQFWFLGWVDVRRLDVECSFTHQNNQKTFLEDGSDIYSDRFYRFPMFVDKLHSVYFRIFKTKPMTINIYIFSFCIIINQQTPRMPCDENLAVNSTLPPKILTHASGKLTHVARVTRAESLTLLSGLMVFNLDVVPLLVFLQINFPCSSTRVMLPKSMPTCVCTG